MALYSTQALFHNPGSGAHNTTYTVPAGHVFVVRDISAACDVASSIYVYCGDGGPANANLIYGPATPVGAILHWEGRVVLNAGQTITVEQDGGQFTAIVSGYLLTSP